MLIDFVSGEEKLYRRVPADAQFYRIEKDMVQVSSTVFNDRNQQVSVDRAKLCNNDPKYTQKNPTDGVLALITKNVRAIDSVSSAIPAGGNPSKIVYVFDVKHDPIKSDPDSPDNLAHAVIISTPDYANNSAFKKLKERLALLVSNKPWDETWEIQPS